MRIDVCMRVDDITEGKLNGATAVVFDVLRATSTIVTALAKGCRGVVPVAGATEARKQVSRMRQKSLQVILGGERGGQKLEGFDCGNSPLEYTGDEIAGKIVVLTTTNGTKTIRACEAAARVYIGSFLNARAVAERLYGENNDVTLVCAGTEGEFSLEDAAAAGLVVQHLVSLAGEHSLGFELKMTDAATALGRLAAGYGEDISRSLYDSVHGRKLLGLGFKEDLAWCGKVDLYDIVPRLDRGEVPIII